MPVQTADDVVVSAKPEAIANRGTHLSYSIFGSQCTQFPDAINSLKESTGSDREFSVVPTGHSMASRVQELVGLKGFGPAVFSLALYRRIIAADQTPEAHHGCS